MGNPTLIALTSAIFLFVAHQSYSLAGESSLSGVSTKRILTSEEQIAADAARQEIAQVLEKNLIKFFTLVAADSGNGRGGFGRQDEDDDDATLNPNTLPQVAQILGAIFAGGLNLTAIVDRTFTLIPDVIRNQVDGLFKLLTGQPATTTTTTPKTKATTPKKKRRATSKKPKTTSTPLPDYELEPEEELTKAAETSTPTPATTTTVKYRRARNRTTVPPSKNYLMTEDDELYRLEEEVILAAIDSEPYIRDKEPRFFIQPVREILTNLDSGRLNLTQIIKFLPDLFAGARQAFVLLENLGQLAGADLEDEQVIDADIADS